MKYRVWYSREFRSGLDRVDGGATAVPRAGYVQVAELERVAEDEVYRDMQGEFMSVEGAGYLQGMIGAGQTDHTSMSVGDCVEQENGVVLMCDSVGWRVVEFR